MAQELVDILENNAIPSMKLIHDCVDTGDSLLLTGGVSYDFPCDSSLRNYKNNDGLYDNSNSSFKNHIDDGFVFYKIKCTLNGNKDAYLRVRIYVPHPTFGDIDVDDFDMVLHKNSTDTNLKQSSFVYMGTDSEAKTYGFKIEITPSANMTLKARSILIMA